MVTAASMTRSRIVAGAVVTVMNGTSRCSVGRLPVQGDEVDLLADAAVGAAPAVRHVLPRGPGREALVLVAGLDLVDIAAPRALGRQDLVPDRARDAWVSRRSQPS